MTKTNAMRLLDAATIEYSTKEYEYDESDLSGHHAAEVLGIPAEQVFKTLVTKGDKDVYKRQVIPFSFLSSIAAISERIRILAVSYTHLDVYKRQSQPKICP